jgi:hypothetical protein
MAEGVRIIDLASLARFADAMERLRRYFEGVGGPSAAQDPASPSTAEPFVTALWRAQHQAVDTVATYTTVADQGFHGIGYQAAWFGARVADLDDKAAQQLLGDARKAVPGPREGLPAVDPRFDRRT